MRILIVEDESKAADYLQKSLRESGYMVEVAVNGFDGRYMIEEFEFDLVILDVMLPGLDGWALLALLRAKAATPVLFLTARDAIEDRVRGLELGADDYLSSLSHSPNCWRACAPCCVADRRATCRNFASPTCSSTCCAAA